jgi:lysozyme
MRVTPAGIALLHDFEGLRLEAYDDNGNAAGGVWTIGRGTTRYPPWHLGGRRVRMGDACTLELADLFFRHDLMPKEDAVDALTRDDILPRQFNALVSFTYNTGEGAYRDSTLRRLVNADPNNPAIRGQFMRWHYQAGEPVFGLWRRRHRESDHYFGILSECPPFPHEKAA